MTAFDPSAGVICIHCGAPVLLCNFQDGSPATLDFNPSPEGDYMVDIHGIASKQTPGEQLFYGKLRTSHFATCKGRREGLFDPPVSDGPYQ